MTEKQNGDRLALLGGPKIINYAFKRYNSIGTDEVEAAKTAMLLALIPLQLHYEAKVREILFLL